MAELTQYEEQLIEGVRRRGELDPFTEYFFNGPEHAGTWYTPEDRPEFYERIWDIWKAAGRPDGELRFKVSGKPALYTVHFGMYGDDPAFLLPHGYRFLPWFKAILAERPDVVVVKGATGCAKTSSVGIFALTMMACYGGYDFANLAPSYRQAQDIKRDILKWIPNSNYEKFVVKPRSGNMFWNNMGIMTMTVKFEQYPSTFRCMTLGDRSGDDVLGDEVDAYSVDECGLVDEIDDYNERLATRIRGTRRSGMPRYSVPSMFFMTNPHPNAALQNLVEKAEKEMVEQTSANKWWYANPRSDDNIYVTKQQLDRQRGMLGEAAAARWLGGEDQMFLAQGTIAQVLLDACKDDKMEEEIAIAARTGHPFERVPGIGITRYELPYQKNREYAVFGDPGTQNLTKIDKNNVPVVIVWDVTSFPRKPVKMVAYRIFGGDGAWTPWVDQMIDMMSKYHTATGGYDATSSQSALSEFAIVDYPLVMPISFSGTHVKRICRTFFQLCAGYGLFQWPFIQRLWQEVRRYKEMGRGMKNIPDDTLAAFFCGCWWLRFNFYNELPDYLKGEEEEEETFSEQVDVHFQRARSRYGRRRKSRHSVRGANVRDPLDQTPLE